MNLVITGALLIAVGFTLLFALFAAYGWVAALLAILVLVAYGAGSLLIIVARDES